MGTLIVEAYDPRQSGWRRMGELRAGNLPGSMSHDPPGGEGRQMILFTCHGDYSTVQRSVGGGDLEMGKRLGSVIRTVVSEGYETLAELRAGQQFEALIAPDGVRIPTRIRWRHE